MEQVLLDQVIETDYGQFDLSWGEGGTFDGDFDRFYRGQINGLVGAANLQGVHVNLARRSGGSPVRIVLLDAPPGNIDGSGRTSSRYLSRCRTGTRWSGATGGATQGP